MSLFDMRIERPGLKILVEYDPKLDEVVFRSNQRVFALKPEQLMEAVERRVDDARYRPITEDERVREIRERFGPEQPLPPRRRPKR